MNTNQRGTGTIILFCPLMGLALMAACSNDAADDSSPELFTPPAGTATVSAPLRLFDAPEKPMPSKGATLLAISIKLAQEGPGRVTDDVQFEIADCLMSVSYSGTVLVSDIPLINEQGLSPCRPGKTPVDVGTLLVGTRAKSGAMAFTIRMANHDRKVTVEGSTAAIPVQPGGLAHQDLVANALP